MCEAHTPLSLSGNDTFECTDNGFFCLPHEVQLIILNLCPLWALSRHVTVSSRFSALITNVVSSVHVFDFSCGSPEDMKVTLQLLLLHSASLKTITGVVLVSRGSSKWQKKHARQCSPDQLFALVQRNAGLEHLVLYDHGVVQDTYLAKLLEALQPCEHLRLLYSESFEDGISTVQEFVSNKKYLCELAFPNMNGFQTAMEGQGWTGLHNSKFGTHTNGRPIQVLLKHSPIETQILTQSTPVWLPSFSSFGKCPPKATFHCPKPAKTNSLRDSVRRSTPEIFSE